jgi:hypothetical protein
VLDLDINTDLVGSAPGKGSAAQLSRLILGPGWCPPPERSLPDLSGKNVLSLQDWQARAGDMVG